MSELVLTEIKNYFQSVTDSIIPILISVFGAALVIYIIFKAVGLAKNMFSTITASRDRAAWERFVESYEDDNIPDCCKH